MSKLSNKAFIALCLSLTLTACAGIYGLTDRTKRTVTHSEPYQCSNLDSPFPEDWTCSYEGIRLSSEAQNTMNTNIQINKDLKLLRNHK